MMGAGCKKTAHAEFSEEAKRLWKQAPVAKFQIQPPASFSAKQIVQNGVSEFQLRTTNAQVLRMIIDEKADGDPAFEVAVFTDDGKKLSQFDNKSDCIESGFYLLPEAGTYKVRFDSSGFQHTIDFSLLSKDDPQLIPGLRPDDVTIDTGEFTGSSNKHSFSAMCANDGWLAHLVSVDGLVTARIIPVAGYNSRFGNQKDMSRLADLIKSSASKPLSSKDFKALPYAPDKSNFPFWIQSAVIVGDGWHGARWVEGTMQNPEYDGSLSYTFKGLTDDGRFFIWIYTNIRHLEFDRVTYGSEDGKVSPKPPPDHGAALAKTLSSAQHDSFQPDINKLDKVVKSLKVRR